MGRQAMGEQGERFTDDELKRIVAVHEFQIAMELGAPEDWRVVEKAKRLLDPASGGHDGAGETEPAPHSTEYHDPSSPGP